MYTKQKQKEDIYKAIFEKIKEVNSHNATI